jgi:uncharacterized integral membrane protein
MNAKSIIVLVLLGLLIIVCIQNVEVIQVDVLFWRFNISKLLLLIITFIIGIFTGILIPGILTKSKAEVKNPQVK